MEWYLKVMNQYADFRGRARRQEYWMFTLFFLLFTIPIGIITFIAMDAGSFVGVALICIWFLAHIIPSIAVTVRRLHDMGQSGWWYLISLLPFGNLILFVFTLLDSQPYTNKWGPSPKYGGEEIYEEDDVLDGFS